jgi:DNA-binding transcriptional ArsR family regulator
MTTKEEPMSRRPSLSTTMPSQRAARATRETPVAAPPSSARKRYSASTAALVVGALQDLERIDDVVTITALARRTGLSRPTVRAVLQQECGWTVTQSRHAHRAGVRRGRLLQAVAGHPGLAHGRATLRILGWPNLQRAQRAAQADAYPALQRGRATQASRGWPSLRAAQQALSITGYPHLAQGRANLGVRGWPNWQRAQDVLKAQDYLPLLEAQRLRTHGGAAPQTDPATDRRRLRGRATRVAILEALRAWEGQRAPDPSLAETSAAAHSRRVTGCALAVQLQLHPATVYAHLQRIRLLAGQEIQEMIAEDLP